MVIGMILNAAPGEHAKRDRNHQKEDRRPRPRRVRAAFSFTASGDWSDRAESIAA